MRAIIAIDGPAGSGKSTVARGLAGRLGYRFLDTGAFYRAVTLEALRAGLEPADEEALAALAAEADIRLVVADGGAVRVLLGGEDVSGPIRGPDVTTAVSTVAALPGVRSAMVRFQREFALGGGVVAEGRDIGTVVFPDADVKFYLDASPHIRAARRAKERGEQDVRRVEEQITARDRQDSGRAVAPLRAADDAVRVNTDDLDAEAVVELLESTVRERIG